MHGRSLTFSWHTIRNPSFKRKCSCFLKQNRTVLVCNVFAHQRKVRLGKVGHNQDTCMV